MPVIYTLLFPCQCPVSLATPRVPICQLFPPCTMTSRQYLTNRPYHYHLAVLALLSSTVFPSSLLYSLNGKQHLRHFEDLVMPCGLTNAPAIFQSLVNEVLREILERFVFVYLDYILNFSRDPAEHVKHVRLVLQHLLDIKLFIKAKKCKIPRFHCLVPGVHHLSRWTLDGLYQGEHSKRLAQTNKL